MRFPFNKRRGGEHSDDSGLGIVEVLAAMLVFAIVAVGIAYSLVNTATMTRQSKLREVATHLAAQEIDLARAFADPSNLPSATTTPAPIDGVTYKIVRTVDWVTPAGAAVTCSTGGELSYRRVNVSVEFPGVGGTQTVRSDTIVAPSRSDKPNTGTVYVMVKDAAGAPVAGVVPSIKSGSVTIKTGVGTDAAGCSVITDVTAGLAYSIEIFLSGYIGTESQERPATTVAVTKSTAVPVSFTYDRKATLNAKFATNAPTSTVPLLFPTAGALNTNLATDARPDIWTSTTIPWATGGPITVYPSRTYQMWAGPYTALTAGQNKYSVGCIASDPGAWEASGTLPAGARQAPVLVAPGGSANVNAAMGIVEVTIRPSGLPRDTKIRATLQTDGDAATKRPACTTATTFEYTWSGAPTVVRIVLPWGKWKLTTDGRERPFILERDFTNADIDKTKLKIISGIGAGTATPTSNTLVLDPRGVTP